MMQGHERLIGTQIPIIDSLFLFCRRALLVLLAFAAPPAFANHPESDECPDLHISGGEDLTTDVTVRDTGQPVYDGMIVPTLTHLRFHARGTAFGRCEVYIVPTVCQTSTVQARLVIRVA